MASTKNNIIIKDRDGNDVVYEGVSRIRTGTTDGSTKEFVIADDIPNPVETTVELDFSDGDMHVLPYSGMVFSEVNIGKPEGLIPENIIKDVEIAGVTGIVDVSIPVETTVELDFSEGNMNVLPDTGSTFSEVTIEKPESLVPENVVKDVEIAGIVGTLDIPNTVETTVNLDFSEGNMEVIPEDGEVFSKTTIVKPGTLIPENIADGVNIAGIIGTLTGGGGSGEAPKIFMKKFKATADTYTGVVTLATAAELNTIGYSTASKRFAMIVSDSMLNNSAGSFYTLLFNAAFSYDISLELTAARNNIMIKNMYHSGTGAKNTISFRYKNAFGGSVVDETIFYADGELRYNVATTSGYTHLKGSNSTYASYWIIAGCS